MSAVASRPLAWIAALSRRAAAPWSAVLVATLALVVAVLLASPRPRASAIRHPVEAPASSTRATTELRGRVRAPGAEWTTRAVAPAAEVPPSVLLKVAQANILDRGGICTVVEGVAGPGATVRVDGTLVQAEAGARYRVQVPRKPGSQSVLVVTRDRAGLVDERRIPCEAQGEEIQDLAIDWHADARSR